MDPQCLLRDFGDTLCDELSLWRVSPHWMEVYRSFGDGLGAAWNRGDLDTAGFVAALARQMPLSEAEIDAVTDVIVVSAAEKTTTRASSAAVHLDAWAEHGAIGYLYTTELGVHAGRRGRHRSHGHSAPRSQMKFS